MTTKIVNIFLVIINKLCQSTTDHRKLLKLFILFNLMLKHIKKIVIAWYPITYVIMMHCNIINFYFHFLIQKIRKIV